MFPCAIPQPSAVITQYLSVVRRHVVEYKEGDGEQQLALLGRDWSDGGRSESDRAQKTGQELSMSNVGSWQEGDREPVPCAVLGCPLGYEHQQHSCSVCVCVCDN